MGVILPKPPPKNAGRLDHYKCDYCDAVNHPHYFKCHNCGAYRKGPEKRVIIVDEEDVDNG